MSSAPIRFFDRSLSAAKLYVAGTHRTRSPSETLADYARFMPQMGITRLANVTGLDCIGLPVYTAIRPNSRSLATSQGKGLDAPSAKASALMEAIELWHGEHLLNPLRRDSLASLRRGERVVDLAALPLRNAASIRDDQPLLWVEGFDLLGGVPTWAPFDVVGQCTAGETVPPASPFASTSTGLASGNHLLEAIVHALCEVIEHDAESLLGEGYLDRRIDLDAIDDDGVQAVLALLRRAGVAAAAFDATSDVGVPTYGAFILERPDERRWRSIGTYCGWGTHLSPVVALSRALTEAVQSRLTFVSGSRDDLFRRDYWATFNEEGNRLNWESLFERPYQPVPFDRPSLATPTFEGDLALLLDRVAARGIRQVVAVDLGRPALGIPVVKVVVPGLNESVAGFQPVRGERS